MNEKNANKSLALLFHENTKAIRVNNDYDKNMQYKIYPNARAVELGIYLEELFCEHDFFDIILSRQSTREWQEKGINIKTLSQLLYYSCGIRKKGANEIKFRTYASAGARYPIEVYSVILNSDDVEPGIYHYNVIDNSLELIKSGDFKKEVFEFYKNQPLKNTPSMFIFLSMVASRTMDKYDERGYRFALIDAGHLSQNIYLVSEALGLGLVELGAGTESDEVIDRLIGLNTKEENIFLGFALGQKI